MCSFYFKLLSWLLVVQGVSHLTASAEGSKQLNQNGGNRAYINASLTATPCNPFPMPATVWVYVKNGERFYLGSSAQGIGTGTIIMRDPNGNLYSTGNSAIVGRINNRNEEVVGPTAVLGDGGYVTFTRLISAADEGVWEIAFIPPDINATTPPPPIAASGNWVQPANSSYIAAFDVTVKSTGGGFVPGRVFTKVLNLNMGSPNTGFRGNLRILTDSGYQYTLNPNGFGSNADFSIVANNKGFKNASGGPSHSSVNSLNGYIDPRIPDTGDDVTYKLFFNTPASSLPTQAPIFGGTTWLLRTPVTVWANGITFTGAGDTLNTGGNFTLTTVGTGKYEIFLDINKNNSYTDTVDKVFTGYATSTTTIIPWDGTDGLGAQVSATGNYNVKVHMGRQEVHLFIIDVENNPNGFVLTRTNGFSPNDSVYWNDNGLPLIDTPSAPITNLTGISSTVNGHRYGSSTYPDSSFGSGIAIDTWTYTQNNVSIFELSLTPTDATRKYSALPVMQKRPTRLVCQDITKCW
ncbi:hypothetical protein HHL17_24560 [Chitinophaga sp. G-6-1-13]|uniref:Uncharacterized protein n=1 Tax=Chitinophaga fulva TaxID=2728842 RepID=A0A848GTD7_9BACT|nr:hypothetical protein [Chitinophaga fulva]NML40392.1 hypothetical protein [Chitinophaga fulva]